MSGNAFRGVSAEQDARFGNKEKKLLKSLAKTFPPEYSVKVDMNKINWEAMKVWIAKRLTELLGGVEDDVLIGYVFEQLEGNVKADGIETIEDWKEKDHVVGVVLESKRDVEKQVGHRHSHPDQLPDHLLDLDHVIESAGEVGIKETVVEAEVEAEEGIAIAAGVEAEIEEEGQKDGARVTNGIKGSEDK
ncbi:putative PWI domain-containing protein [Nannochloris sp. 'desiccata']|nr:hypothetical protein KSW81_006685 [Chlorella desiccata (nom. nud.)]KAH7622248.1 putative PWI domain-containing protein [Chlorella desiccata (nom. nud.)]